MKSEKYFIIATTLITLIKRHFDNDKRNIVIIVKPASIMAVEKDGYIAVIPINITRGLTDKLVEKRKGAALELEK